MTTTAIAMPARCPEPANSILFYGPREIHTEEDGSIVIYCKSGESRRLGTRTNFQPGEEEIVWETCKVLEESRSRMEAGWFPHLPLRLIDDHQADEFQAAKILFGMRISECGYAEYWVDAIKNRSSLPAAHFELDCLIDMIKTPVCKSELWPIAGVKLLKFDDVISSLNLTLFKTTLWSIDNNILRADPDEKQNKEHSTAPTCLLKMYYYVKRSFQNSHLTEWMGSVGQKEAIDLTLQIYLRHNKTSLSQVSAARALLVKRNVSYVLEGKTPNFLREAINSCFLINGNRDDKEWSSCPFIEEYVTATTKAVKIGVDEFNARQAKDAVRAKQAQASQNSLKSSVSNVHDVHESSQTPECTKRKRRPLPTGRPTPPQKNTRPAQAQSSQNKCTQTASEEDHVPQASRSSEPAKKKRRMMPTSQKTRPSSNDTPDGAEVSQQPAPQVISTPAKFQARSNLSWATEFWPGQYEHLGCIKCKYTDVWIEGNAKHTFIIPENRAPSIAAMAYNLLSRVPGGQMTNLNVWKTISEWYPTERPQFNSVKSALARKGSPFTFRDAKGRPFWRILQAGEPKPTKRPGGRYGGPSIEVPHLEH